jgi:starch-binding outer membrane protein, SusD/RagB family
MKNIIFKPALAVSIMVFALLGCSKLLDTSPQTQIVTPNQNDSSLTAADAESQLEGVYGAFKGAGYGPGIEVNVNDRVVNGDVQADNCYAGGDNTDNITIDKFRTNAANGNVNRDWNDAYSVIGVANTAIALVGASKDPALSATRKGQILGEARFIRAFQYFDLVRLWGNIPLILSPIDASTSETLIRTAQGIQEPADSIYAAIKNDLWFAKATVGDVVTTVSNKYTVTQGTVNALLAKVYATQQPANWDSVGYYCDQLIPDYSLVTNFNDLWDNNHKNNSEAIWEIEYDGYSSSVGNYVPSLYIGAGYKKFNTPTNDLVNVYVAEGDTVRYHASVQFVNYGWPDAYWTDISNYPVLAKYTDPNNGLSDFYIMRLADILLLRAEAYNTKNDVVNAALLVNQVRTRVGLPATTAANQSDMALAIEKERRLELAFEGHRWFDLVRTGRAIDVMNAEKDGSGNSLNYNVQPYQLIFPIPSNQLDINPLLKQNPGY